MKPGCTQRILRGKDSSEGKIAGMTLEETYSSLREKEMHAQEEMSVASCEDVYAVKESLARGRFSWTVFFGCLMIGEVLGAVVLICLCFTGIINPDTWVSVIPLASGAIVGAIPGFLLAR